MEIKKKSDAESDVLDEEKFLQNLDKNIKNLENLNPFEKFLVKGLKCLQNKLSKMEGEITMLKQKNVQSNFRISALEYDLKHIKIFS